MLSFDDIPAAKRRVNKLLKTMRTNIEAIVINGIEAEWALANGKNDAMVEKVAAAGLTAADSAEYFNNHAAALEAFKDRKTSGMNLSKRVWNLTQQYKAELEMGLDIGIRDGLSAQEVLSTQSISSQPGYYVMKITFLNHRQTCRQAGHIGRH